MDSLAWIKVANIRGDKWPSHIQGNSFISKENIVLTEKDRELITTQGQAFYAELEKRRIAIGLDEFDNSTPESVQRYFSYLEDDLIIK